MYMDKPAGSRAGERILTNATVVAGGEVFTGSAVVRAGRIAAVDRGTMRLSGNGRAGVGGEVEVEDFGGDYLLPGLVELHTDNLEKHLMPRPGVVWPEPMACVAAHDVQIAGAGITTVLDALCVGAPRGGEHRRTLFPTTAAALRRARELGLLRAEHFLHLRCEVTDPAMAETLDAFTAAHGDDGGAVRMASVMDHSPGQRQWRDLEKYRHYYRGKGVAEEILEAMISGGRGPDVSGPNRELVLARFRGRVALASHDDTTSAHSEETAALGMAVSEFPTTHEAAARARELGMKVVMGAPNVVRGGSHSGNVPAATLAREGLLDILSSDYQPVALLQAVFTLHREHGLALPDALAMASRTPAREIGLDDRGEIAPGLRADLLRVRDLGAAQVVSAVWREGVRVA